MSWSEADRAKYDVVCECYSSDLSEAEFALIFPLLPSASGEDAGRHARADTQDRYALAPLLREVRRKTPFVTMSFVDSGYNGDEAQRAAFEASRISITVVMRNDKQIKGFIVLPKRWVVERTFGWINRARRVAKVFSRRKSSPRSHGWSSPLRSCSRDASQGSNVRQCDFRVRL